MKKYAVWVLVTILATISTVFADQVIFQPGSAPGKDMWLSSSYNNTAVDDDKLQVGGWGDWYRMFIQFDLSELPQTATYATMHMYAYDRGDSSTPVSMSAYILTNSWSESTQNYYDPLYGYYAGGLSAPTPNSWYGINITGIYNGWKNGTYTNNGFLFLASGNNNQFNVFRSSDYSEALYRPKLVVTYDGANLGFPLAGYTPYTAPIASVFDHSVTTGFNCPDNQVVAYTGEKGDVQYGKSSWSTIATGSSCIGQTLWGFAQNGSVPFSVNGQYDSPDPNGDDIFLFYDGHTGYDYPTPDGTAVIAAASGAAYTYGTGNDVKIVHPSGYDTYYLHLTSHTIINGQSINKGDVIGYTGSGHLHFTVKKGAQRVDPYGWKGVWGTDPLQIEGKDNHCLWENCQ